MTGHSGPYPVIGVILRARGIAAVAEAEGRNQAPASIDQPKLTSGSWVRSGGVVIERTYADALGVRAGDRITLNGRPFTVAGIAVTAASPPYPNLCYTSCAFSLGQQVTQEQQGMPGLIWLTQTDTSTIAALADTARPPRRRALLIAVSARLPAPLLLGLRLAGRRPRRFVLSAASIALLTTTLVTVLAFHATEGQPRFRQPSGISNPVIDRDSQVLLVLTVVLVILTVINAIFTAWTTALDARHQLAVARSLGATPQQVSAGLSAAQLLAAVPGTIVGIPAGIGLFYAASHAGTVTIPPAWWLLTAVLETLLVLAGLTTIPARITARRPVAEILQSETA